MRRLFGRAPKPDTNELLRELAKGDIDLVVEAMRNARKRPDEPAKLGDITRYIEEAIARRETERVAA